MLIEFYWCFEVNLFDKPIFGSFNDDMSKLYKKSYQIQSSFELLKYDNYSSIVSSIYFTDINNNIITQTKHFIGFTGMKSNISIYNDLYDSDLFIDVEKLPLNTKESYATKFKNSKFRQILHRLNSKKNPDFEYEMIGYYSVASVYRVYFKMYKKNDESWTMDNIIKFIKENITDKISINDIYKEMSKNKHFFELDFTCLLSEPFTPGKDYTYYQFVDHDLKFIDSKYNNKVDFRINIYFHDMKSFNKDSYHLTELDDARHEYWIDIDKQ